MPSQPPGGPETSVALHTRALGLRSIKKTVLFDGETPIYHLYYANAGGDASSVLTTFPFRQAGVMGRRGTNQVKVVNLAVPRGSLKLRDRVADAGSCVAKVPPASRAQMTAMWVKDGNTASAVSQPAL